MSEEKVIEIKALSPEENLVGKEMETADSEEKSIYDLLEEDIMNSDIDDGEKTKKLSRLLKIRGKKSKYYADRGNRQRKKFYDQCIVPYGSRKSRSGCRSGDDLYR